MIENFKKYYIKYIVCIVYSMLCIVINNWTKGTFNSLYYYMDGAFIAGASLICIGGLSVCTNLGAFDIFTYLGCKKGPTGVKPSMYEYSMDKKEKRKKYPLRYLAYFIVGGLFVIISLIMFIFI